MDWDANMYILSSMRHFIHFDPYKETGVSFYYVKYEYVFNFSLT